MATSEAVGKGENKNASATAAGKAVPTKPSCTQIFPIQSKSNVLGIVSHVDPRPPLCFLQNYAKLDGYQYENFTASVLVWLGASNVNRITDSFELYYNQNSSNNNPWTSRIYTYLRCIIHTLSVVSMEQNIVPLGSDNFAHPLTFLYHIRIESSKAQGFVTNVKRMVLSTGGKLRGYCRLCDIKYNTAAAKEYFVCHIMLQGKSKDDQKIVANSFAAIKSLVSKQAANAEMSVWQIGKGKIFSRFELLPVLRSELRTQSSSFDPLVACQHPAQYEPILFNNIDFDGNFDTPSASSEDRFRYIGGRTSRNYINRFDIDAAHTRTILEKFVDQLFDKLHTKAKKEDCVEVVFDNCTIKNFVQFEAKENNNPASANDQISTIDETLNLHESKLDKAKKVVVDTIVLTNDTCEKNVKFGDFVKYVCYDLFENEMVTDQDVKNGEYRLFIDCSDDTLEQFYHLFIQFEDIQLPTIDDWKPAEKKFQVETKTAAEEKVEMKEIVLEKKKHDHDKNDNKQKQALTVESMDKDDLVQVYLVAARLNAAYVEYAIVGALVKLFLSIKDVNQMDSW